MTPDRTTARALAREFITRGDALGWFEALYQRAAHDHSGVDIIPWADRTPNPHLVTWLDAHRGGRAGGRALKVGCGLGDDAEELARRGYSVTAFDVSPTVIAWCRRRFPGSPVTYVCHDLLDPPAAWEGAFDLVVEAYTLQVLPPELRPVAMARMAGCLAPGGLLLAICRGREPEDSEGLMPWPLMRREVEAFGALGLETVTFDDYVDNEDPPVRRFRATFRRPLPARRQGREEDT